MGSGWEPRSIAHVPQDKVVTTGARRGGRRRRSSWVLSLVPREEKGGGWTVAPKQEALFASQLLPRASQKPCSCLSQRSSLRVALQRLCHTVSPPTSGALPPTLSPPPASSLLESLLQMLKFYDITDAMFGWYFKRRPLHWVLVRRDLLKHDALHGGWWAGLSCHWHHFYGERLPHFRGLTSRAVCATPPPAGVIPPRGRGRPWLVLWSPKRKPAWTVRGGASRSEPLSSLKGVREGFGGSFCQSDSLGCRSSICWCLAVWITAQCSPVEAEIFAAKWGDSGGSDQLWEGLPSAPTALTSTRVGVLELHTCSNLTHPLCTLRDPSQCCASPTGVPDFFNCGMSLCYAICWRREGTACCWEQGFRILVVVGMVLGSPTPWLPVGRWPPYSAFLPTDCPIYKMGMTTLAPMVVLKIMRDDVFMFKRLRRFNAQSIT